MKLTVIFCDSWRKRIALTHENENFPYQFRTVQIELTPEQQAQLTPRQVGVDSGKPVTEELYQCYLEPKD